MELDLIEGELNYAGEGSGDLVAAPGCMMEAPNCTVVVLDDTVEEQGCTELTLDTLIVGVAHIVAVVED